MDLQEFVDVKLLGVHGDGITDDSAALNNAFNNHSYVLIPEGTYIIDHTLILPSHTHIVASSAAYFKMKSNAQKGRYDFLLANDSSEAVTVDVSITGGIWDGNCGQNSRGDDLFDPDATTGTMFNFRKINGLSLRDMTLKNPLCYYNRFCEARNVTIENIRFESDVIIGNQDGIHFAGHCSDFVIRNLMGSFGSPNDDFLALNADDCLTRQENFDVINGPISNVLVENVYSEKCHCFVRLSSVDSTINNVTIRNVSGACKNNAVNLDAARYCRVPLFNDADKPAGVGFIENVSLENFSISTDNRPEHAFVVLETNCAGLSLHNFSCRSHGSPFVRIRKTAKHRVHLVSDAGLEQYEVDYDDDVTVNASCVTHFNFCQLASFDT